MLISIDTWIWARLAGPGLLARTRLAVGHGGWGARIMALMVSPELLYAIYLNIVFVKGILDISSTGDMQTRRPLGKGGNSGGDRPHDGPHAGNAPAGILLPESAPHSDAPSLSCRPSSPSTQSRTAPPWGSPKSCPGVAPRAGPRA
ncbi:MAG: hypothetical protein NVS2B15_19710 [Pseudarthrobacter sp.]